MGYFGNPDCAAFGGERRISGGKALRPPALTRDRGSGAG